MEESEMTPEWRGALQFHGSLFSNEGQTMKGPGYKLSHDVRRTWKCPACGRERKLPGDTTSLVCNCRDEGTFMAIVVERTVAPRPFQVVRDHDVRSSEFGIDDLPVLQPHPSSLPPERSSPRRPRPEPSTGATEAEAKPETPPEPETSSVKSTEDNSVSSVSPPNSLPDPSPSPETPASPPEDDWGEGIL
jgi:hypothetical protein